MQTLTVCMLPNRPRKKAAGPPFRRADALNITNNVCVKPGACPGCLHSFPAVPSAIKQQRFLPPGIKDYIRDQPSPPRLVRKCKTRCPAVLCAAGAGDCVQAGGYARFGGTFPVQDQGAAPCTGNVHNPPAVHVTCTGCARTASGVLHLCTAPFL